MGISYCRKSGGLDRCNQHASREEKHQAVHLTCMVGFLSFCIFMWAFLWPPLPWKTKILKADGNNIIDSCSITIKMKDFSHSKCLHCTIQSVKPNLFYGCWF